MRYADIKGNDIVNGEGICVSFWTQFCPHHCPGCHNPETWSPNGGKEFTNETLNDLLHALTKNNVHRNLSILGGEPLCDENLFLTELVCKEVLKVQPDTKIYIWTGYTYEELCARNNSRLDLILSMTYYLIDGPFIQEKRDITLKMRGSPNQRIIDIQHTRATGQICIME